jgi:hypothetical protein
MQTKKQNVFKSPDTSKMQEVIIDRNTRIYIAKGDNPEDARARYIERMKAKGMTNIPRK